MRIFFIFILFGLILVSSCQRKEAGDVKLKNEKIISKELVISIFEELVLIESHLQSKYYSYSNYGESLQLSRDSILKAKGISFNQFTNSFDFYSKSDGELVALYQDVLNDYNEKSAKSVIRTK
jgi:hypothetical protein